MNISGPVFTGDLLWLQLQTRLVPHTVHEWSKFKVRTLQAKEFVSVSFSKLYAFWHFSIYY